MDTNKYPNIAIDNNKQNIEFSKNLNVSKYYKNYIELYNVSNNKNFNLELYNKQNYEQDSNITQSQLIIPTNSDNTNKILKQSLKDPWELSINDEKFYINNKIARIFPLLKNFNNFSKIKIDDDSFCYITIREIAELTSKIICYHLLQYNLNPQKTKIVDYTSGVGGNVLSFSKYFKYIYAIEICSQRSEFLKNNIDVYGFKNIDVINKCAIEFNSNDLIKINPNVIFIDPPWGGSNYKSNDKLLLKIGVVGIEELIISITEIFSKYYLEFCELNPKEKTNNINNKFVILKLPKNYDVEFLYNYLKNNNNTTNYNISSSLYILNKMLIVVCELQFIY